MNTKREKSKLRDFISNLMKGKTNAEIFSAEQSLRSYIELAQKIAKRKISNSKKGLDDLYKLNEDGGVLED